VSYSIHITAAAERDMINASDYIDFTLKNPKAADDLLDEAETKINKLADRNFNVGSFFLINLHK
jgi:plasmid stabilization system protein ParE